MVDKKPLIDVLVVVPLSEELEVFYEVFPYEEDLSERDFLISKVKSPTPSISVYLIKLKRMGNAAARDACNYFLARYTVGLIICYGIAGGLQKDLRLGDVCISHDVLDLSDQSKIEDQDGALAISLSPTHLDVELNLCSRFGFVCENPAYANLKHGWEAAYQDYLSTLQCKFPKEFPNIRTHIRQNTRVFFGSIVSYADIASDTFKQTLKSLDRNVLAVDTESAGVFECATNHDTSAITIRAISDFSDKSKSQLEADTHGLFRDIAAMNAARYLEFQLRNTRILEFSANKESKFPTRH